MRMNMALWLIVFGFPVTVFGENAALSTASQHADPGILEIIDFAKMGVSSELLKRYPVDAGNQLFGAISLDPTCTFSGEVEGLSFGGIWAPLFFQADAVGQRLPFAPRVGFVSVPEYDVELKRDKTETRVKFIRSRQSGARSAGTYEFTVKSAVTTIVVSRSSDSAWELREDSEGVSKTDERQRVGHVNVECEGF
ncbi:MAG: hypothetical protein AB7G93_12340 [Bdellovibrionales bacterium]